VGGGVHRSAGSYNLLCSQLVLVCSPLPCSMVLRGCRLKVLVGRNHCVSACPPQVGSHLTSCSLTCLTLLCALQVWSRCSVGIGPRSSHGDCCLHRTLPFPDFAQLMLSLESTVRWERGGVMGFCCADTLRGVFDCSPSSFLDRFPLPGGQLAKLESVDCWPLVNKILPDSWRCACLLQFICILQCYLPRESRCLCILACPSACVEKCQWRNAFEEIQMRQLDAGSYSRTPSRPVRGGIPALPSALC
jgi:hypothetical protein